LNKDSLLIDQDAWDSYIQGPGIESTNNFFPMDLSNMPMQTEQAGMPATGQAPNQQPAQGPRTNVFGHDVYMGVSIVSHIYCFILMADSNKADPKTSSGEGYALGFMLPKRSNS